MSSGLKLDDIFNGLTQQTLMHFVKTGIFLSLELPFIGASPDAINATTAVQIKSPTTKKKY